MEFTRDRFGRLTSAPEIATYSSWIAYIHLLTHRGKGSLRVFCLYQMFYQPARSLRIRIAGLPVLAYQLGPSPGHAVQAPLFEFNINLTHELCPPWHRLASWRIDWCKPTTACEAMPP
ncbi:hypothetical protein AAKU67_003525 [Oxalobacteraceae bacterium GrIS 2.11]|uniref:hypothetical protein n=1 Tax=Undibacterium sp. GrIS 1.8 TaxID=3143934 RepID=UPI00339AF8C1